jgi:hypothetical protein
VDSFLSLPLAEEQSGKYPKDKRNVIVEETQRHERTENHRMGQKEDSRMRLFAFSRKLNVNFWCHEWENVNFSAQIQAGFTETPPEQSSVCGSQLKKKSQNKTIQKKHTRQTELDVTQLDWNPQNPSQDCNATPSQNHTLTKPHLTRLECPHLHKFWNPQTLTSLESTNHKFGIHKHSHD